MAKSNKTKKPIDRKATKSYIKYGGMPFQIAAYVIVGVLLGKQLDKYFATERPFFTAGCAILFLSLFFVKLVAEINKK